MICPKCGSENVNVQVVTSIKQKSKKGIIYWLIIGWWWEPIAWLFFTIPKLIIALFGNHKKIVSKESTEAVCQSCGHRWRVDKQKK